MPDLLGSLSELVKAEKAVRSPRVTFRRQIENALNSDFWELLKEADPSDLKSTPEVLKALTDKLRVLGIQKDGSVVPDDCRGIVLAIIFHRGLQEVSSHTRTMLEGMYHAVSMADLSCRGCDLEK